MGIRANLSTIFGGKASVIGLPPGEQPDRPLEKTWDDFTLLTTYGDDPWPYICANKIAEQGSLPPLRFGTELADGTFKPVKSTHALQQLFDRPNPLNTGGEFRQLLLVYMEMVGHAPIEIVRPRPGMKLNRGGSLRVGFELYVHNPGPWRIVANTNGTVKGYLYLLSNTPMQGVQAGMVSQADLRWTAADMTYMRWPNPLNRWYGQGRIAAARQAIMAEEYANIRDKKHEQQMGVPPGILTSEMPLGQPQADELQRRWEKAVGGYQNAGKIAILGSKTTYQSVAQNATDSAWIATRENRVETIASAFGVPMPLVRMQGSTFSNAKEARSEFWEGTLHPRLLRIQEMVTERLIPMITDEPLVAKFDFSMIDALNENQQEIATRAESWVKTASTTKGEIRKLLGLEPFGDERDDEIALPTMFRDTLAATSFQAANPGNAADAAETAATQATPEGSAKPKPPAGTPAPAKKPVPAGHEASVPHKAAFPGAIKRREPKAREAILAPSVDEYKAQLSTFFVAQRGALLGTLSKALPVDGYTWQERAAAALTAERFRKRLHRISEPPIKAAYLLGAQDAALSIGVSFSIGASPQALAAINARLVGLAEALQGTTVDDVSAVIRTGLAAGDTAEAIRSGLSDLFSGYQDWRLDRISRTEATNAYNVGAIGQYKDSGIAQVYVTDGDGDEECAAADGATWSLDEAESDPSAHPNCTRSFDPIPLDETGMTYSDQTPTETGDGT